MSDNRPKILAALKRQVYTEAGHRCAISTCRGTSALEIYHIKPWNKVREHQFENLILLCAVCHGRCTKNEISRKDMEIYKANLSLLNSRHSSLERRLLELFGVKQEYGDDQAIILSGDQYLSVMYLKKDELVEIHFFCEEAFLPGNEGKSKYGVVPLISQEKMAILLTKRGEDFVRELRKGKRIF